MKNFSIVVLIVTLCFAFVGCQPQEQPQEMDFGIEDASVLQQFETILLEENTYGEVLLLGKDNEEEIYRTAGHYLAVQIDDKKIVKDLSTSRIDAFIDGMISLADFDGDTDMEILLQQDLGGCGGYGSYLSRVFDFKNGELIELFSSQTEEGERMDTGFSITLLKNKEFEIKNTFTNYSEVFRREEMPEEYFEFWYDEKGEPMPETLLVDSFYEFVSEDVDGDGVSEIKGKQYTSLIGHADGIGIANTVLKYNNEKACFEVVSAYFSKESEQ